VGGAGGERGGSERREGAREAMRVAFEHLASRVGMALQQLETAGEGPTALVVAGGVAANRYLRHVLRCYLDAQGFGGVELVFPPPRLCTDNAAMIAWAGMEMFEQGWRSGMEVRAIRKWSLDPEAEDGGVLGVGGGGRKGEGVAAVKREGGLTGEGDTLRGGTRPGGGGWRIGKG